jgi:undecaprenyl-diphosphatase
MDGHPQPPVPAASPATPSLTDSELVRARDLSFNPRVPEWVSVLILGIIEGITEFLPISSTGHLLIAQHWLGRQPDVFNVGIQSGAVLAVIVIFTDRLKQFATRWRDPDTRDYLLKLCAAFGLTAAGGLLLKYLDFGLPDTAVPVAWATLIGGVLFLVVERWLRGRPTTPHVNWPAALAVGAGQLLAAVFPGASRSGSTILMALGLGVNRPAATEFSFLLGIPTLIAAGALEMFTTLRDPTSEPIAWGHFALGFLVSAITAFVAVRWLLRYVQSHTFEAFGYYRIAVGLLLLWVMT